MEILEILKNKKAALYPEDLDFFETELATGDYDDSYIVACREALALAKRRVCRATAAPKPEPEPAEPKSETESSLFLNIQSVAPKSANPMAAAMSVDDTIFSEIRLLRENDGYKSKFKQYVHDNPEIDDAFVDKHHSFFRPWELSAIVSVKPLSEALLEKYFDAFDKDKLARYQCFSEGFFMKHYAQLDAATVLTKGKNKWRKKENRSKQLDIFLRLKGVKL